MTLHITDRCINCDMCAPECPNQAIKMGLKHYQIDVNYCNECVGYYVSQNCISVCPINCIKKEIDNDH